MHGEDIVIVFVNDQNIVSLSSMKYLDEGKAVQ